ncbi:hypothetical protein RJ639_021766 [Escallonia herrerae]|uniref:RNase H type-1 domain-containing protein n=1 Tax=Escallonia herrerae TaxID=1293975 RepID=A0AA88V5S7_9ASTE|nr:hypothetical protein RJ639_021766 [Escallonia herrerae]
MRSAPSKRDKNLWCRYHNDHGHITDNCELLKRAIEALIKRGHLRRYVNRRDERREATPLARREEAQENAGVINTISRGIAAGDRPGKGEKLTKARDFAWTKECQKSFEELKHYLSSPPLLNKPATGENLFLYLSINEVAVSTVLVREEKSRQTPVYYFSKTLTLREDWRLGEFDIKYKPRAAIKAQALSDFVVECMVRDDPPQLILSEVSDPWLLYVNGSSKVGSSGVGLILISPAKFKIEYALCFDFQASNNEAEYEALLAGIRLAHSLRVDSLSVHSDSQLVVNHILGEYEARDERMAQYLQAVKSEAAKFKNFAIRHIPRYQMPKQIHS